MKYKDLAMFALVSAGIPVLLGGCSNAAMDAKTKTESQVRAQKTASGVVVYPQNGDAEATRVEVYRDNIFRVTNIPHENLQKVAESLQVISKARADFDVSEDNDAVTISTSAGSAVISKLAGAVTIYDADGTALLSEVNSGSFSSVTANPLPPEKNNYAIRQQWNKGTSEAFYGLGQHQTAQVNFAGDNIDLTTHNLEISIPFVVSDRNYGVLWDNASITHFGNPEGAKPISESVKLYDEEGNPGGLTAKYYDGDKLLFTRVEREPDYQFLSDNTTREHPFPEQIGDLKTPRVVWSGSIEVTTSGNQFFKLYNSGYAKLKIDGKEVLNRWRMNWNPWYHDAQVNLSAGKKVDFELDWDSQGGYVFVEHTPPLPDAEQHSLSFASESGKSIDYYVVVGDDYDEVIAGYRTLTGKAVLLPKWAYGFWQSRERYKNQEELVDVVKEYRKRKIPLDNIVLDWSYWPEDAWGSHEFDKVHFPDPEKMVEQVHDLNANIMISVWPKFYASTDNYKAIDKQGFMLSKNVEIEKNKDWIGEGYLNGFYDPYSKEAQALYLQQIDKNLNSKGFDAWWLDASEPDIHSNLSISKRKEIMTPLAVGSGTEYFNSYALPHAEGVYSGERQSDPEKRSFILTRSGFGGIQRTGAAIWSGDTVPRWSNLREQIAAGISTSLSGMPNWTMDIGGFTPEDKYRNSSKGFVGHYSDLDDADKKPWQELNLRWFQFGAFVPLFRSHGQNPYREIYNIADEGSQVYASMVYYTKLRYRLMPYIYSEGGKQFVNDNTLMRGLIMDFPGDDNVKSISDTYMFGPAFLVAPVYEEGATTRDIYLPASSTWYDFYSAERYQGGQQITVDAPLTALPLFVRSGSIVPSGPAIQTVFEQPDAPILLTIYAGEDGDYQLYEDDGRSYDYEKGEFSLIDFHYDDSKRLLTIGERQGGFPEQISKRKFSVRLIDGPRENADKLELSDRMVTYTGQKVSIQL